MHTKQANSTGPTGPRVLGAATQRFGWRLESHAREREAAPRPALTPGGPARRGETPESVKELQDHSHNPKERRENRFS